MSNDKGVYHQNKINTSSFSVLKKYTVIFKKH